MFFFCIEQQDYDEVYIQNYTLKLTWFQITTCKRGRSGKRYWCKDYSMRIWIDPEKMSSYNIAPKDVQDALKRTKCGGGSW
jgi:HAE1 family hydrophobic/amphiphilic exporter-1